MQPPTWRSVGIPDVVVRAVKAIPASFLLDSLVHQLTYHYEKKITFSYNCDNCTYVHTPHRYNEEVSQCPNCGSRRVKCVQSLKFIGEKKVPYYSRGSKYLNATIQQMYINFNCYFGSIPRRNIDWEWHNNQFHVAFAGGDTACEFSPRAAIAKASLLVPYLWDSFFDWKNNRRCDKVEQKYISHILNSLVVRNR